MFDHGFRRPAISLTSTGRSLPGGSVRMADPARRRDHIATGTDALDDYVSIGPFSDRARTARSVRSSDIFDRPIDLQSFSRVGRPVETRVEADVTRIPANRRDASIYDRFRYRVKDLPGNYRLIPCRTALGGKCKVPRSTVPVFSG